MTDTSSVLTSQLEALRDARASGVREVEYESREGIRRKVVYRTDAELVAAINDLEKRLATLSRPPVRTVYINSLKGV